MKKISRIHYLFFFIISILLTACATPYQPQSRRGGYSELALSQNMYKVTFKGNSHTSAGTVQNLLLRRCAELTLAKGYKYFITLDSNIESHTYTYQAPTTATTSIDKGDNGTKPGITTTVNPGTTTTYVDYTGTAVIRMLMSNQADPTAYEATVIRSNFEK